MGSFNYIIYTICFCFLFILFLYWTDKYQLKKKNAVTFWFHLLMAFLLGNGVKAFENQSILNLSGSYWTVFLAINLLFGILLLRDLLIYRTLRPVFQNYLQALYYPILLWFITAIVNKVSIYFDFLIVLLLMVIWLNFHNNQELDHQQSDELGPDEKNLKERADVPITNYDDLFPSRKRDFNRISYYLDSLGTRDPYAIAINAAWGEGKTSFINALKERLKEQQHEIIFIQPMILDSRDKLLDYVFNQLEAILIDNGIFTGKGSPYKQYYELVFKFVNFKAMNSLASFFDFFTEEKREDLREYKTQLEENLNYILSDNRKVYLIVDDLDRVEENTIYDVLTFIKEIVDIKGITVLFLMDYEKLVTDRITPQYLAKFINKSFDLQTIEKNELFSHYLVQFLTPYHSTLLNDVMEDLKLNFEEYLAEIESGLEKLRQTKLDQETPNMVDANEITQGLSDFRERYSNARSVKKMISGVKETFDFIYHEVGKNNPDFTIDRDLEIGKLVLKLNVFQITFPERFRELSKEGSITSFINKQPNSLVASFFREMANTKKFFSIDDIIIQSKYKFYNKIIYSDHLSLDIFIKEKQKKEKLLEEFDNLSESTMDTLDFEKLKEYLEAINYSWGKVGEEVIEKRTIVFTELTLSLIEKTRITLGQAFELLGIPNRFILLHYPIYLKGIYQFVKYGNGEFANKKEKLISKEYMKHLELPLIEKILADMMYVIWIFKLNQSDLRALLSAFESVHSLKSLNQLLTDIVKIDHDEESEESIEYFSLILEYLSLKLSLYEEDELLQIPVAKLVNNLYNFMRIYQVKVSIEREFLTIPINKHNQFELDNEMPTLDNISSNLTRLYSFVMEDQNQIDSNHFKYFHFLLNQVGDLRTGNISKDEFQRLIEIFHKLKEIYNRNPKIYQEDLWLNCMVRMAKVRDSFSS